MIPVSKELLRSGDIILFHTKGLSFISIGIRMLTNSYWNHCGLYIEDVYKKGYIIEALGRGVMQTSIDKYIENRQYILKTVRLKKEVFKDEQEYFIAKLTAIERIKEKIGTKYDWWAISWLGIIYITKALYRKNRKYIPIGNPLQSRNKFFCSELVATAFQWTSSIYKYPNLFAGKKYQDISSTTPRDIAKSENVFYIAGIDKI